MIDSVYEYPGTPHIRRHGPVYATYKQYRSWLRDEFDFRCVYCLFREVFARSTLSFHADHFVSQKADASLSADYDNLVWSCNHCNQYKSATTGVPSPEAVAFGASLSVRGDGTIEAHDQNGRVLCRVLNLNSDSNVRNRRMWLDLLDAVKTANPALYEKLTGYPNDVPDLSRCRPKKNTRPSGITASVFERRKRGTISETKFL